MAPWSDLTLSDKISQDLDRCKPWTYGMILSHSETMFIGWQPELNYGVALFIQDCILYTIKCQGVEKKNIVFLAPILTDTIFT